MAYDRYSHDPRANPYHHQQHIGGQVRHGPTELTDHRPYGHQQLGHQAPRDAPRYDPTVPRLTVPQVLGYSPPAGGAGTTFSVQVTDISNDPRTYKFVFGSKRVGAFLERAQSDGNASVLAAQAPRFKDCEWWSSKVPVYLVIADSQTDLVVHQAQICEFFYEDSPSPRKRPREDSLVGSGSGHLGSPIKRPNSSPSQAGFPKGPGAYGNPPPHGAIYHSPYSQASSQGVDQRHGKVYREFPTPMSIPYSNVSSLQSAFDGSRPMSVGRDRSSPSGHNIMPSPLSNPEATQTRYIAEPQDHYTDQARSTHTYGEPPHSASRSSHLSPGDTPSYYQGSVASSPATWKSPRRTASSTLYNSPPSSVALPKSIETFDASLPPDESVDPAAPLLQRTSTLSSSHGSGQRAATPASGPAGWLPSNKAKLEVLGDLDDMSRNWSADEFAIRRRLVQFWRRQEGNVIKINFRPVEPGVSRPPRAIVISCIYWEERQECFFTSVDAIYLLESLVGNRFVVEEKNRIRRNLEGFRPLTVSKGKADSESFFKLIMGFPAPKPRNIEKDVKAFPWRILTSALRKIVGKYSASYDGLTERSAAEQNEMGGHNVSTSGAADMPPPPTLVRNVTSGSQSSQDTPGAMQMQPSQVGHSDQLPHPQSQGAQHHHQQQHSQQQHQHQSETQMNRPRQGSGFALPPPRAMQLGGPLASRPRSPGSPKAAHPGLSIRVPHAGGDNLPILDGPNVSTTSEYERRPSAGAGFPLSGISNVDFSDFFQSPGNQPGTSSGWPTLNSLFPPPSAGFGPDHPPPKN